MAKNTKIANKSNKKTANKGRTMDSQYTISLNYESVIDLANLLNNSKGLVKSMKALKKEVMSYIEKASKTKKSKSKKTSIKKVSNKIASKPAKKIVKAAKKAAKSLKKKKDGKKIIKLAKKVAKKVSKKNKKK